MEKQLKYKTPYTKISILLLLSQPFGLIMMTVIFLLPIASDLRTTYIFRNITFFEVFPFAALLIMTYNFLFMFNKFPVWATMNETGIRYRAYTKIKRMIPWDTLQDVGIIIEKRKSNKKYIYFSTEPMTEQIKKELIPSSSFQLNFKKYPNVVILVYGDETYSDIRQYYRGEIKGLENLHIYNA